MARGAVRHRRHPVVSTASAPRCEAERLAATLDRNDAALRAGGTPSCSGSCAALRGAPARRAPGRSAHARPVPQRPAGRRARHLPADPRPAARGAGRRSRRRAARGAPADPDRRPTAPARPPAPVGPRAPPRAGRRPPALATRRHPAESRHPAGGPRATCRGGPTSFVGRERELRAVVAGHPRTGPLVTLTGVGGVGKSRLGAGGGRPGRGTATPTGSGSASWRRCPTAARWPRGGGGAAGAAAARPDHRADGDRVPAAPGAAAGPGQLRARAATRRPGWSTRSCGTARAWRCWPPAGRRSASTGEQLLAGAAAAGRRTPPRCSSTGPGPAGRTSELDRRRAGAVAEICRRLDGLPLAIELAAARMRVMSAAEVAQPAGRRPAARRRPAGGRPRHQSLAAAIDWSYRLLPEPERRAVRPAVGVRRRRSTSTPCTACAATRRRTEDDTLDLLTGLVDKSMVTVAARRRPVAATGCWRRCAPTARERLREAGVRRRARRGGTRAYYAELAEQAAAGCTGRDERAWVERALPDYDNLRAAFERASPTGDADLALRLVTVVPELVHLRVGYESAGWAERALDLRRPRPPAASSPPSASPRAARGTAASSPRARALAAARRRAGAAGAAPPGSPTRATCSPTSRSTRATPTPRCGTTGARCCGPARTTTRSGWSGRSTTSRCATRCCATRSAGCAAAQESLRGGRGDRQPDRAVDGALRARAWC